MARYEVAMTRRETMLVRYYMTVEAESPEAAKAKVRNFDTTVEEEATLEEGKCLGMDDSELASVDFAELLKEKADA